MTWTAEQILSLAPDAPVAKDGKALAAPRKWAALARDGDAVWGEIKGSGKTPYQAQIDLTGPAFKCTCPSRKRPCKHTLALFLLFESQPVAFAKSEKPDWVTEYLANRARRAKAKEQPKQIVDAEAQIERVAERMAKVAAGLNDLELWLKDIVRQGLASLPEQPQKFWRTMAARMIDAQAPGVARMVNDLAGVMATGEGWQEKMLERLSKLYLLVESFKRLDSLPADTQADARAAIGWAQSASDIAGEPGVKDVWAVPGRRVTTEDALRTQRTWLWGENTNRAALLVDFAASGQTFETNLLPGTCVETEIAYFPGAHPLRAVLRQNVVAKPMAQFSGYATIDEAMKAYSSALARNPWIELFPMAIQNVIPAQGLAGWAVRDAASHALPLSLRFEKGWSLLALSGGRPVSVFGEWDGEGLLILSGWAEGRFVGM